MRMLTAGAHGQDLSAIHPISGRHMLANGLSPSAVRHVAWRSGGMMLRLRG